MADPRVRDDLGRMAMTRGPLVYCAESNDNGYAPQLFVADPDADVIVTACDDFDGVLQLTLSGRREDSEAAPELYVAEREPSSEPAELKMIPYALWANRGASEMQVWLRRQ